MQWATSEIGQYPTSARFLMGRLRQAMSDEQKQTIEEIVTDIATFPHGHKVQQRGQICDTSVLLIDGFMLRQIETEDGVSTISMQVPGDFVDLHAFALKRLDHDIVTVGKTQVAFCPHERLEEVVKQMPGLTRILWFSTMLDAAMHRNWILQLEQLPAAERVAFLFAEIDARLRMVDLALDDGFDTPLTQAHLASMCGTSAVHMNRVLSELAATDVVRFDRGRVTIPDRKRLQTYSRFEGSYLYGAGTLAIGTEPYA